MVEVSQQRKQRKHIVGTSQVYMRMAKALREQIKNVVICKNILGCLQINRLVNGETARELDGELKFDTTKLFAWFHSPELYSSYDTYAKMKRYSKEWKGVSGEVYMKIVIDLDVLKKTIETIRKLMKEEGVI